MKDPDEGLTPEGFIQTGVRRNRVSPVFEPVIEAAIRAVESAERDLPVDSVSLYLYSVTKKEHQGAVVVANDDVNKAVSIEIS